MSADIEIIQDEMDITVDVHGIRIKTYNKYTYFDMSNESHRQGIKTMIEVLQHQLEIHEGK